MKPLSHSKEVLKDVVRRIPVLRKLGYFLIHYVSGAFKGSEKYWEERYAGGGHSGPGSIQCMGAFKAEILNAFVRTNDIQTVIEYGCGDGQQLELTPYPYYTGFDVSPSAVALCKERFGGDKTRVFKSVSEYNGERAELTLSLDVIYHLVEDKVFHRYMEQLFSSSDSYVIIYSSDSDNNVMDQPRHIKHRTFSQWVKANAANWELIERIPNKYSFDRESGQGSFADFFIYKKCLAPQSIKNGISAKSVNELKAARKGV
jgi:SAM-dependent methyltransferase